MDLKALSPYTFNKFDFSQIFLLVAYGFSFLFSVVLISYMRYYRRLALRGDASAAHRILLPSFEPLLWILASVSCSLTAFTCVSFSMHMYTEHYPPITLEIFYSGRQFAITIPIVFMKQSSVSLLALRRTIFVSTILSTYTIPVVWCVLSYGQASDFHVVLTLARALMLPIYIYVFVCPPRRATKRTIREMGAFAFIYYGLHFTNGEFVQDGNHKIAFVFYCIALVWWSLSPLVTWRVLLADTEHWRLLGKRSCALHSLYRRKHDLINEYISTRGVHVQVKMHRSFVIDFAYLDLRRRIGISSTAVIFSGVLQAKIPVAVKTYIPHQFDEDTVAALSHEAALCGSLHHPNIVKFYGICVYPPMICLVSELCQASLRDMIDGIERHEKHVNRKQLLLDIAYMLDAARAVAYLHSFSPPLHHRDIKPANFLVGVDNTVKLAGFGASRTRLCSSDSERMDTLARAENHSDNHFYGGRCHLDIRMRSLLVPVMADSAPCDTLNYLAPEVVGRKSDPIVWGEAADIYALAVTMWDILHPGHEKFTGHQSDPTLVVRNVIDDKRPEFQNLVHPSLLELIKKAWQPDPEQRPSATTIVCILESIQREVAASYMQDLQDEIMPVATPRHAITLTERSFTGKQAIEIMMRSGHVASSVEGIRIGNGLMDAGLLHHFTHSRSFEDSRSLYYIDQDDPPSANISSRSSDWEVGQIATQHDRCHRKTDDMLTKLSSRNPSVSATAVYAGYRSLSEANEFLAGSQEQCWCRKLGQRMTKPMNVRRKHRRSREFTIVVDDPQNHEIRSSLCSGDDIDEAIWSEFHSMD